MSAKSGSDRKLVPVAPDGGWGWIVVLGSFFIHVFADGFVYSFGVLARVLIKEFNVTNTYSAVVISLLTGITLGTGPLASAACSKFGCRVTTITGACIAFVGCLCSFFATSMWHIVISVGVIMGSGFGLMYCPAIVIVTMYFENKRSLATGIAVAGAGVGTVIFAPINAVLMTTFGWRSVFLVFLLVIVLCALCGAAFAPLELPPMFDSEEENAFVALHEKAVLLESLTERKLLDGSDADHKSESIQQNNKEDEFPNRRNIFRTISTALSLPLLADPIFLLFAFSNLLTSVGFNAPLYFLPLHSAQMGLSEMQGSQILSVSGITNTLGRLVFGVVADNKLPLPYGLGEDTARNRLWMYNISLSVCGLLTTFCYKFEGFVPLIVYACGFGFTIASYICLTSVILVDLVGLEKMTNAFGLLLLWQAVGTVFGPPFSGFLADYTGNYTLSFVFCGINLMISGLMLFGIPLFQKKTKAVAESC